MHFEDKVRIKLKYVLVYTTGPKILVRAQDVTLLGCVQDVTLLSQVVHLGYKLKNYKEGILVRIYLRLSMRFTNRAEFPIC